MNARMKGDQDLIHLLRGALYHDLRHGDERGQDHAHVLVNSMLGPVRIAIPTVVDDITSVVLSRRES